jgi:SAM-dependent methyltransferase
MNVRNLRGVYAMTIPHPIPLANASPRRLTSILQEVGFTFDAVKDRLGTDYPQWPEEGVGVVGKFRVFFQYAKMRSDIGLRMLSPMLFPERSGFLDTISAYFRKKRPKDPLDLLIWLFLFNEPVQATALGGVFSPNDLDALAAMNLIRMDAGAVTCDLALFECGGLFLATDAMVLPTANMNSIMPLLPESFDFVESVSRKPVNSTLDLCTGSGVHALIAARHSKHVVASDINPRALRFAEFNAWFNGITNIEFCQGDLFCAVGDRAFDLILANPPFMPVTGSSPNDNYYCGGKSGDVLWSQILQGLEKHLRPGGLCQMIYLFVLFGNESQEAKVRALLGPLAEFCNVLDFSNPIVYRNEHIADATSVHWGVTSIKRNTKPGEVFYVCAPYRPPLPFDVSDLLLALEQTSRSEERTLACERHYAQSRPNRKFHGTGTLLRAVSRALCCVVCCDLILRRALRAFLGALAKLVRRANAG